jgi:hypothetical protein
MAKILCPESGRLCVRRGSFIMISWVAFSILPWAPPSLPAAEPDLVTAGNCNGDAALNLADTVFLLNYLFNGEKQPPCRTLCDFQQDGELDVSDIIGFLQYFLQVGNSPAKLSSNACQPKVDTTSARIELTWDKVTTDVLGKVEIVAGYRVYMRPGVPAGASPSLVLEVGPECGCATLESFQLVDLTAGSRYYFSVTAFDLAGNESDYSDEAFVDW